MKQYSLITESVGYVTKPDKTNVDERAMITGSQNVLINDAERIQTRKGYELFGAANTALTPVQSSFDWQTSSDTVLNLRSYGTALEVYLGTVDGVAVNAWTALEAAAAFSAVDFVYDEWWSATELINLLLFVNGTTNLYDWSGAVTTLASATSNSLTKNGTDTWAQARFLANGTRRVIINGTAYTYTGGETTTTLTGVTPDPSGEAANSVVTQQIRTNANTPAANYTGEVLRVLNNHAWVGSNTDNRVFVSKNTDFTDYTKSTPRASGEGETLVLDSVTRGFARFDQEMVVFSGRDDIYKSEFQTLDVSGSIAEVLKVKKIKTSANQTAQSQDLITEFGDFVAFLTFEPALRILANIEEIATPQVRNYSNPIKPDFDDEDFTNGHLFFTNNRLHICSPVNSKVYMLEFKEDENGAIRRLWQPPQVLPVRRFSVIFDALHGHSNGVPETYALFSGTNDNGNPFSAKAVFAYRNFNDRVNLKNFNEYFVEGYISANTTLQVTLNYDFDGFTQQIQKDIPGTNANILFQAQEDASIGILMPGLGTPGAGLDEVSETELPKFKTILTVPRTNFGELQAVFETDATDYQWQILSHGPNVIPAKANLIKVKI